MAGDPNLPEDERKAVASLESIGLGSAAVPALLTASWLCFTERSCNTSGCCDTCRASKAPCDGSDSVPDAPPDRLLAAASAALVSPPMTPLACRFDNAASPCLCRTWATWKFRPRRCAMQPSSDGEILGATVSPTHGTIGSLADWTRRKAISSRQSARGKRCPRPALRILKHHPVVLCRIETLQGRQDLLFADKGCQRVKFAPVHRFLVALPAGRSCE